MTTTSEDEFISMGLPYFRLVQPQGPAAPFTQSSYFRLGSYIARDDEEKDLVTGLTTTTSTVTEGDRGAIEQAGDAIKNAKNDPAKKFSATSQAATSYTTTPSAPIPSSNNGALLYTDGDLHENVLGAALQKYGQGHVTSVENADSSYQVKAGKADIYAKNGVFIKAGTAAAPANIELTAEGYIKQTAYGDLEEVTYGITHKRFHGIANDMFMGLKFTFFFGLESVVKLSGSLTIVMSAEATFRLSARFSLTLAADKNIVFGVAFNSFTGTKTDLITGLDDKTVVGISCKLVLGPDMKFATSDLKILSTTDIKSAPVGDLKKVGVNLTICDVDLKKEFAAVKDSQAALKKAQLQAKLDALVLNKADAASIDMAAIKTFL